MRANAREGFRERATEGVWSLLGLAVEPVLGDPDSSKKLSSRQLEFSND